ncbi:MAG: sialidase family protein [Kiritimatiellaeota bacterium]|nr:sialidase family protein [Kiritimatiellota bacterium]
MPRVKVLDHHVVYENPMPHLRSRHGYFPGMVQLPSGDLLSLFVIGEAFESVDTITYITRSHDLGRTWQLQGPLYDNSVVGFPTCDTMKATVLRDGSLVAIGYRFHRRNPDEAIGNPKTNGVQPADDIVSFSRDEGKSWSVPIVMPKYYPEAIELSGPCLELAPGELLAGGSLFPLWDGSMPSPHKGLLLRSKDQGRTWVDGGPYFTTPANRICPYETRFCRMGDGRLVAIVWAFDQQAGRSLNNHITVSHDDGRKWSAPMDIGVKAQASSLLWWKDEVLLGIHACREGQPEDIGLYLSVVDFSRDRWQMSAWEKIWGRVQPSGGKGFVDLCKTLKFGQPSLLRLANGELLATHWCVEDGQGRILTHRLQVEL